MRVHCGCWAIGWSAGGAAAEKGSGSGSAAGRDERRELQQTAMQRQWVQGTTAARHDTDTTTMGQSQALTASKRVAEKMTNFPTIRFALSDFQMRPAQQP